MSGAWRLWLASILALLMLAPASGQVPPETTEETAPSVIVENATIEDRIVPLEEPGTTEVEVQVGCETGESAGTTTTAEIGPVSSEPWANTIVSPSTLTWSTQPDDCPATSPPFRANTTVSVSLDQGAPAYEDSTIPLEVVVTKESPQVGESRTYGPFNGSVSFTPGYFHQHNVRIDADVQQGAPNETLVYEGLVDNLSNHESRFDLSTTDAPENFTVEITPSTLTVAPEEKADFQVEVGLQDPGTLVNEIGTVQVEVAGASTGPTPGTAATSQFSVQAKFKDSTGDPRDSPGLATPGALAIVAALALARAARRQGS